MSVPHCDPDASQSSILQFLTPLAPKCAVPALRVDTVVAPIADGGVIIIDDDEGGHPMSSVCAGPAVRAATIPVASGSASCGLTPHSVLLPVRRRRVTDDDTDAVMNPIIEAQAPPTARRRRIIVDDDDDAIAAPVPTADAALPVQMSGPSDDSALDAAEHYEDEVTNPHYLELCSITCNGW